MSKQKNELSAVALEILSAIKDNKGGLTVADIKKLGIDANSSHLVALKKRGLIDSEETEIEVATIVKRKVQLYKFVDKK